MSEAIEGLPLTVSQWRRNSREEILVRLDTYQDHPVFDIRAWYRPLDNGELKPGRTGITLSVSHLAKMAEAVAMALDEAQRLGLIEASSAGKP